MKSYGHNAIFVSILLLLLFLPAVVMCARHIGRHHSRHSHHLPSSALMKPEVRKPQPSSNHRKSVPVEIAGSSLPDCSHACGSCSPCRLVMVSFVCAAIEEAETCPMAYKCMCRNKSYPVP